MTWLLNMGFDLTAIALILFIVWLFVRIKNTHKAFKWLVSALFALMLGILSIGYGGIKIANQSTQLPQQNQSEVDSIKSKIADKDSSHPTQSTEHHHQTTRKKSVTHHKKSATTPTIRVVNKADGQKVASQVSHKHHVKVDLVAKIMAINGNILTVRGVHSPQIYTLRKANHFKKNQFIIIKGTARSIHAHHVIDVRATSLTLQNSK